MVVSLKYMVDITINKYSNAKMLDKFKQIVGISFFDSIYKSLIFRDFIIAICPSALRRKVKQVRKLQHLKIQQMHMRIVESGADKSPTQIDNTGARIGKQRFIRPADENKRIVINDKAVGKSAVAGKHTAILVQDHRGIHPL